MNEALFILELIGTVAFSISGAVVAIRKQMDLLGVLTLGLVTAVGGGIIRDTVIGRIPPAAFENPVYTIVALITATCVFVIVAVNVKHKIPGQKGFWKKVLEISDAVGLGVFTVLGIRGAQTFLGTHNVFLLLFVGVVTGCGGGVLRDVFANQVPSIFKKHIYASASLFGAVIYMIVDTYLSQAAAVLCGMFAILFLRLLASHYEWNLPIVKLQ